MAALDPVDARGEFTIGENALRTLLRRYRDAFGRHPGLIPMLTRPHRIVPRCRPHV